MTALALFTIRQNPNATYREFHAALRGLLPSEDYPQSPQLEASDTNKDRRLFEALRVEPGPGPIPEPSPSPAPEPIPAPESPGCLMGVVQQVTRLFKG
jgi:hypothetical protein